MSYKTKNKKEKTSCPLILLLFFICSLSLWFSFSFLSSFATFSIVLTVTLKISSSISFGTLRNFETPITLFRECKPISNCLIRYWFLFPKKNRKMEVKKMMNSPVSYMGNDPMKDKELENKWHNYCATLQQEEEEDINDPDTWGIVI